MKNPRIGAVTVNYNAGDYLTSCVESLLEDGVGEVIVVDNGSRDDSLEKMSAKFPDVPILKLPNPGFGAACTAGANKLSDAVDTVFFLNPDAMVEKGSTQKMLDKLDSDPKIAIIGPKTLNPDRTVYPSVRRFPSFVDGAGHALLGMFFPNNRWTKRYQMQESGNSPQAGSVDWVSGAAMFTRRSAFDEVNGFDPGYFMYLEDTDLCWRLRKAGYDIQFLPEASIVHVQGVSTRQRAYKMIKVHHRSSMRYYLRTASGIDRVFLPLIVIGLMVRLPIALGRRWVQGKLAERSSR